GVSSRLTRTPSCSRWQTATSSECLSRFSWSAKSQTVVPFATLPGDSIAPAVASSASISVVLPDPAWPTSAMSRTSAGSWARSGCAMEHPREFVSLSRRGRRPWVLSYRHREGLAQLRAPRGRTGRSVDAPGRGALEARAAGTRGYTQSLRCLGEHPVRDLFSRLLNFERGELPLAVTAALFYFFVLCGYGFLRPVREAMGVSRGMDDLHMLWLGALVVSLVIVLAVGDVVSRVDRRRFIPIGYLFVIVCLGIFSALLIADAAAGGGLIGTDSETTVAIGVGYTYYIWLSVINLFIQALFWAFMVDVFDSDQGKRMFAFIGIGGTLGAIVGGWATNTISGMSDSVYLPAGLMLVGAALFGAAIVAMLTLDRMAVASDDSRLASVRPTADNPKGEKIGGSFWDGLASIARSPYLIGIGGYIMLMAVSNTLIYFTQANVILENTDTFSQRVGSFAAFDMAA